MRLVRRAAVLTVIAAGVPVLTSVAQTSGPTDASVNLRRLPATTLVKVSAGSGGILEGRVRGLEGGEVLLSMATGETRVVVSTIDTLWVRGNATRKGVIVGGLIAGVPSVLLWSAFCNGVSEGDCENYDIVLLHSAVGAGVGAVLGAAIGSTVPAWHRKYATPGLTVGLAPSRSGVIVGMSIPVRLPSR